MAFCHSSRRGFMVGIGATLLAASGRSTLAAPSFKTVEPGILTLANSNEMPMIAMEDGKLKKGSLVLMASVGAGFTVGATLLRWAY